MRGHITKRAKGTYTIVLNGGIDPVTGKRKQHWITVKGSKKDAEKKLSEILHNQDKGIGFVNPGKLTLQEYLESWLEDYCKPNLSPDSTETYRFMCNKHINPELGHIPLSALNSLHIQKLENKKLESGRLNGKGGLSNRTVKYIHITLTKALKMAVKSGLLMRNPCDSVEPPKVTQTEFKILNEDDINKLLEALKGSEYYPIFFTDLFSGMRRSELLALRWQDVDLLSMTASVNRVIKVLNGGGIEFRPPKTQKSRRLIALTPANTVILREHLEARKQYLKSLNPNFDPDKDFDESELVFCHPDGKPYLPDSVTHAWMTLVKRIGLDGVRLHDVRHSHASILLKQGVHPKIVQERLGHATINTTLDIYSHVVPGLQAAAAAKFDEIFKPKKGMLEEELDELISK